MAPVDPEGGGALLVLEDLEVRYGATVAVDGFFLTVGDGETVCILGPSGCGKSTVLRAVAGLEPPTRGRITLDGVDLAPRRPDQRRVGLMFQDHTLFPHRDVAGNVGFGLRMRGVAPPEVDERVEEVLRLVGLAGYGRRAVTELSGGEQQRVALARAVAPRPRLLMLDEPLGSLDRALRDRLLVELPELFRELGTTVLYVTHDQEEALAIADRVVLMRAGRLVQVGTPDEVWRRPADAFVARFLGYESLLEAVVTDGTAATAIGTFPVGEAADGPGELLLLPEAITLRPADPADPADPAARENPADPADPAARENPADPAGPGANGLVVRGEVVGRAFAGDHHVLRVATAAGPVLPVRVWRGAPPASGTVVTLHVDPTAARLLR